MDEDAVERANAARLVCEARDRDDARLLRAIPLEISARHDNGAELKVFGIIAWTTWFEIAYRFRQGTDEANRDWREWHLRSWRIEDDLGNEYVAIHGAGGGGADRWTGRTQCAPSIAVDAATVHCVVPSPTGDGSQLLHLDLDLPTANSR